jgi:peptidoglycan hydrolase-like amidase/peptidoglycan hydrolase CwlO-like protein
MSSSCSDLLTQCESSINQALQDSQKATAPLQSKLDAINTQITGIKNTIANIEINLAGKKKDIDNGYADLAKQETILDATIRDYYIKSYYNSPLLLLLSANSASQFTQLLGYQKANADRDKAIITNIAVTIQDLQKEKKDLENQEANLASLKTGLDQQSAQLDTIVSGAKAYQSTLSNQLASLNSIQQSILSARLAGLNIPLTAYAGLGGGCSSDKGKDPGFSPKFGFFTYGVPNRVGLNQYGAKGRAEANPSVSYWDILNAYYNFSQGTSSNPNIHVVGTNNYGQNIDMTLPLEEYLQHIYEMPASWPAPALRAQAVAARSYVLAYTNNGANSICPSDHCQEFKNELNGQPWIDAVNATANQVMTYNGSPISAWFSSTHGGYVHASGGDIGGAAWTKNAVDTTSGSAGSFSDLQNNAYDKGSPWFYCDWGSRSQYNNTAWLQSGEIADIVNAILLAEKDSSTVNHLYQTDKPNPAGTDTWSADQVRQQLGSRAYSSISSISVSVDFGSGTTTSVNISGDAGSVSIPGSDFKNYFNLRAPANIQIVGPLYNVETN